MTEDLLLEIGTEEIPAGYIPPILEQMEEKAISFFEEERVDYKEIAAYGTPRRLVLYAKEVSEEARDLEVEILGPSKKAAFDEEGRLTKAVIRFTQSQGVKVEDLKTKGTKRGEYLLAIKKLEGKATPLALQTILPKLITSLSFPKSMRWGEGELRFARPIRWLLALFGEDVINFGLDGIRAGRITYGHRFLAPNPIEIKGPSEYLRKLEKAYVLVLPERRKEIIQSELLKIAYEGGGRPFRNESLIDEVTYLVEYPVVIRGTFDKKFLKLPSEVLVAAMSEHQRYFPIEDSNGRLLNSFLVVSNGSEEAKENIRVGNERVLQARLEDAAFFFDQDMKISLEARLEKGKGRIFQEKLGTMYQKTERVVKLAQILVRQIDPTLEEKAKRAALLSKADLSTEMVGEFPKLQGIMGYHYALCQGEDEEVAKAIREHYMPRFADDRLPETQVGMVVSMADKMDSVVSLFTVGLIPTGSEDPYALRRQAQGMINIILENNLTLSIRSLIKEAMGLLDRENGRIDEIEAFFSQRITAALANKGIADDEIEAVMKSGFDDPLDTFYRAKALRGIRKEEDFEHWAVAFKRMMNIIKKEGGMRLAECNRGIFKEPAELTLYQTYRDTREEIERYIENMDYKKALAILATLREPVDRFFDDVLVMVEDERIRENRLTLLSNIASLFLRIADISYLQI